MVTLETTVLIKGIVAREIYDFMLNLTDTDYQQWWQGTHLVCHTVKKYPGNIGNLIYVDEYVGKYRLKGYAVVAKLVPYQEIVYQIIILIKIPAWFIMKFEEGPDGIKIIHVVKAGFNGLGKVFDPLIRLFLTNEFEKHLTAHAQEEFPKLASLLAKRSSLSKAGQAH